MIQVIFKAPGKRAEVREIEEGRLIVSSIEKLLGGKAEIFRAAGYEMFAHETGLIDGMEPNVQFAGHVAPICGPVVVSVRPSRRERQLVCDVLDYASVGSLKQVLP